MVTFLRFSPGYRLSHVNPEPDDDLPCRADLTNPEVERLARSFATNVVLDGEGEESSLRSVATANGIPSIAVEMGWRPYPLVHEGDPVRTVRNHFKTEERVVTAPFDGLIVGALENPVAAPGHPLCHIVRLDRETLTEIEREIKQGEFDGYRAHGDVWVDE